MGFLIGKMLHKKKLDFISISIINAIGFIEFFDTYFIKRNGTSKYFLLLMHYLFV